MEPSKAFVEPRYLEQMENLLAHSTKGIHVLFDNRSLADVLSRQTEVIDIFSFENVGKVQKLFVDFINKTTYKEKREYLSTLDKESHDLLIRAYFNIVESTILDHTRLKH